MKLARVVATVVSTINVPVFDDRKLLLCDLVSADGAPAGGYLIAVDTVGAGTGETVLLMDEGNSARQILGARDAPVRTVVVGIVDHVELAPAEVEPAAEAPGARPAPRARRPRRPATRRRARGTKE
ncbi:MAG TPA: EutN/CcmL family microcompartment protein [Candidatus Deferrimicrobiaceae bacterium]|nr:EutN/CcmL family microcompartment protein [Candidatus Deferrimicrobiaceae bacterium]